MSNPAADYVFGCEPELAAAEYLDVLRRSGLAARRPVDKPDQIEAMLRNADLVVTARDADRLIGVSRAITDFAFCTYLSDLAVDVDYQRQGVGQQLLRRTHQLAGLGTHLILLAAPDAASYYPHIGIERHESCWIVPRRQDDAPGS